MDPNVFLGMLGVPAPYVTAIVAGASVASAILPQAKPGSWWERPRKMIDVLAFNLGNARNAPQPPPEPR